MGLFDIFSSNDAQQAASAQTAGIQQGYNQLSGLYNQGRGALTTNYTAGLQPFQQNYATATQGTNALGNALGLNGAAGNAAAQQAFFNNPGYQFQLNQGDAAINAQAAATGYNNSGNQLIDLSKFNQGLANTSWNQYLSNLQPYLGYSTANASGIGGLYSGLGNQLAGSYGTQGNAAYGAQTSIGNANANADLAGLTASGNEWGAILGGLGLGANLYGSYQKSDERAKDDIEPIGKLEDGQNVYRFTYKGDSTPQIGLIAQEVEKTHPEAVIDFGGVKFVNYGRATNRAAELFKMAA
jgi:Chaperone of endosialidase